MIGRQSNGLYSILGQRQHVGGDNRSVHSALLETNNGIMKHCQAASSILRQRSGVLSYHLETIR